MLNSMHEKNNTESDNSSLLVVIGRAPRHPKVSSLISHLNEHEWQLLCNTLAGKSEIHSFIPERRCVILPDFEKHNGPIAPVVQRSVRLLFEEHQRHCASASIVVLNCFAEGGRTLKELHRAFALHLTLNGMAGKALILNVDRF
jgi:hypothetical protein